MLPHVIIRFELTKELYFFIIYFCINWRKKYIILGKFEITDEERKSMKTEDWLMCWHWLRNIHWKNKNETLNPVPLMSIELQCITINIITDDKNKQQ